MEARLAAHRHRSPWRNVGTRGRLRSTGRALGLRIEWRSASLEEADLSRIHGAMVGVLTLMGALPPLLGAQPQVPDGTAIAAYQATVGQAFSVSADEVGILAEWRLRPDEIVVVLFVARSAGVSPDAVASLRRSGRPWATILQTYSVGASALWLSLPVGANLGPLEATYRMFSATPRNSWTSIALPDQTVIALVNLRVLSRGLGVPVSRVLGIWVDEGDFVSVHQQLTG